MANIASAAAYIFAKNENGTFSILCGKRSGNNPYHQGGLYDVPLGMREPGETPQETAQRETIEETGINLPLSQFKFIEEEPWGDGRVGAGFLVTLDEPQEIGQGDWEHEGFMWLPVEKLSSVRWAYGMDKTISRFYNQFVVNNGKPVIEQIVSKVIGDYLKENIVVSKPKKKQPR